jgi:serine/threonine-protein kinase
MVGAPECPPSLESVILKCLSKKPEARYQTMESLADDIRMVQSGGVPQAVHDMMARSGGFNVPADYFQSGRTSTPDVPKGKRKRLKPAHLAMFAGIAAAVSIVTVVLLKNSMSDAKPVGQTTTTPTEPTASEAVPTTVDVMLASNAPAAIAIVDGEQFPLPKLFTVTDGEPMKVRVVARGFADKTVELDGSEKEVKVTQRAVAVHKPAPKPAAPPPVRPVPQRRRTAPKPKPVDGVVDPWAK